MRLPGRKRRHPPPPAPDGGPPLDVDVAATSFGSVVTVAGELDIATAPRLRATLGSDAVAESEAVVVDLTGVTFMDSSGLAVLLDLDRTRRERGRRLAIACPDGPARLVFDVTGVDEHVALFPSLGAAEAAVACER